MTMASYTGIFDVASKYGEIVYREKEIGLRNTYTNDGSSREREGEGEGERKRVRARERDRES